MLSKANIAQHKVQLALYACGFMFIFTETLLSPFYPQFFAKVFNLDDAYITGEFMAMCRLVVIFSAPLWGLLARHFDPVKLLIAGQVAAAIFTAAIAWVDTIQQFYILTVFLLIFKSSYLLFYTLLIDLNTGGDKDPLAKTVGWVQVVMHTAIVSSTLMSAWVIQVPNPLDLFIYAALIDVLQVLACIYVLKHRKQAKPVAKSESPKPSINLNFVIALGVFIFCFHWAVNIIRPFFTQYTQNSLQLSEMQSAVAYLLPSLMVLFVMPFIRKICTQKHINTVLCICLGVLMLSAVMQVLSQTYTQLLLARCLLGAALILAIASIDIFIFKSSESRNLHFNYSLSIAVQNIALFFAPITAAIAVNEVSDTAPFLMAFLVYGICLLIILASLSIIKYTQKDSNEVIA